MTEFGLDAPPVCPLYWGKLICCFGLVPKPYPTEICRLELVELTEIVGLVPLLIESHVDERERNVIGESPIKLGGRDVRFFMFLISAKMGKKSQKKGEKKSIRQENAG